MHLRSDLYATSVPAAVISAAVFHAEGAAGVDGAAATGMLIAESLQTMRKAPFIVTNGEERL